MHLMVDERGIMKPMEVTLSVSLILFLFVLKTAFRDPQASGKIRASS